MSYNYATALSHLVLAGTGISCLGATYYKSDEAWNFGHSSFLIISINSVLGIWRYGNPDYGEKIEGLYNFTSHLQLFCALPLVTTQIWYNYGYKIEFVYAHLVCLLIPVVLYIGNTLNDDLNDLLLYGSSISLGVVSALEENYWGLAAAISYAIPYFYVTHKNNMFEISTDDLFNYALCFFTFFAFKAMFD